jgi:hypothetical protein
MGFKNSGCDIPSGTTQGWVCLKAPHFNHIECPQPQFHKAQQKNNFAMFVLCAITNILAPCTSNNIRPTTTMKNSKKMVIHAKKVGMLFIFNVTNVLFDLGVWDVNQTMNLEGTRTHAQS